MMACASCCCCLCARASRHNNKCTLKVWLPHNDHPRDGPAVRCVALCFLARTGESYGERHQRVCTDGQELSHHFCHYCCCCCIVCYMFALHAYIPNGSEKRTPPYLSSQKLGQIDPTREKTPLEASDFSDAQKARRHSNLESWRTVDATKTTGFWVSCA